VGATISVILGLGLNMLLSRFYLTLKSFACFVGSLNNPVL